MNIYSTVSEHNGSSSQVSGHGIAEVSFDQDQKDFDDAVMGKEAKWAPLLFCVSQWDRITL